jgi:predicted NAD/FAD-binding protein
VKKLRVAVIGAGLSGIIAGVLLPAKVPGIDLTIFEIGWKQYPSDDTRQSCTNDCNSQFSWVIGMAIDEGFEKNADVVSDSLFSEIT